MFKPINRCAASAEPDLRHGFAPLREPLGTRLRIAVVAAVTQGDVAGGGIAQCLRRLRKLRGSALGVGHRAFGSAARATMSRQPVTQPLPLGLLLRLTFCSTLQIQLILQIL